VSFRSESYRDPSTADYSSPLRETDRRFAAKHLHGHPVPQDEVVRLRFVILILRKPFSFLRILGTLLAAQGYRGTSSWAFSLLRKLFVFRFLPYSKVLRFLLGILSPGKNLGQSLSSSPALGTLVAEGCSASRLQSGWFYLLP